MNEARCVRCDHPRGDHGQERAFYYVESKREVCLACPGYAYEDDTTMYPHGKAWHRFKPAPQEGNQTT